MVTKHKIPCSVCGKPVERFVFCSGACKVAGSRARTKKNIVVSMLPKVTDTNLTEVKTNEVEICKHGMMKGVCKFGCK